MKIAHELWSNSGLINQIMSLELAVGISEIYKQPILLHNINDTGIYSPISNRDNGRSNIVSTHIDNSPKNIISLVEWDDTDWIISTKNLSDQLLDYETISSINSFINCDNLVDDNLEYSNHNEIILQPDKNYHFVNNILFYSRFFKNRTKEIDGALATIKWKEPYYDLAREIASQLDTFSGMHLRMSDHRNINFVVDEQDFDIGLNYLEDKGLLIILSTDDKECSWVNSNKSRFQFLDEIIVNNWGDQFKQLPFNDEVVFGLICNLVLGYSKYFIGTPGSTYTGYIQRYCNMRTDDFEWKLFSGSYGATAMICKNAYDIEKPRWWHEHPISKLRI